MQTLDQQYSAIIYEQVSTIKKEETETDVTKYGAMSHKLPILIHTAGLAQALAFVHSRGAAVQRRLLEHLAITIGQQDADTLLKTVREADVRDYTRLTRQSLAALLWYKRFAQSILGVDLTEAGRENEP